MRDIEVCRKCPEYHKTMPNNVEVFCDSGIDHNKEHQHPLFHRDYPMKIDKISARCFSAGGGPDIEMFDNERDYIYQDIPEECIYVLEHTVFNQ